MLTKIAQTQLITTKRFDVRRHIHITTHVQMHECVSCGIQGKEGQRLDDSDIVPERFETGAPQGRLYGSRGVIQIIAIRSAVSECALSCSRTGSVPVLCRSVKE